mmetsp:Transcript_4905/g.7573  ORF Transcript_4905/g.7573 Transcript_4905/m.7573 type:complete len:84 (-) Transcript_4905:196-447(-)
MDDTLEAIGLYAHGSLKRVGDILPMFTDEDYTIANITRPPRPKKKTVPSTAFKEEQEKAQEEHEVDKTVWLERLNYIQLEWNN